MGGVVSAARLPTRPLGSGSPRFAGVVPRGPRRWVGRGHRAHRRACSAGNARCPDRAGSRPASCGGHSRASRTRPRPTAPPVPIDRALLTQTPHRGATMTLTISEDPVARPATEASPPPRPPGRRSRWRQDLGGWGFVAPAMVIILGLSIFPAAWAFFLSLQKWNGFSEPKLIGARDYSRLMSDSEFWDAVTHTGVYVLLFVPASVLLGLFLAVALNRDIRFIGLYRTAI